MAKFIEVKTKIGAMLVNLDTVDCISNNEAENHAVLSFAGSEETLNIVESYESIVTRIRGMVCFGEKAEMRKIEHGKWIGDRGGNKVYDDFRCSICGHYSNTNNRFRLGHYCENCGACMYLGDDKKLECGKWIKTYPDEPLDGRYYCSRCNKGIDIVAGEETPIDRDFFYCPNCGMVMSIDSEDDKTC